jgi:hypothetical protein
MSIRVKPLTVSTTAGTAMAIDCWAETAFIAETMMVTAHSAPPPAAHKAPGRIGGANGAQPNRLLPFPSMTRYPLPAERASRQVTLLRTTDR